MCPEIFRDVLRKISVRKDNNRLRPNGWRDEWRTSPGCQCSCGEQGFQSCHPLGDPRGRSPARHWPDRRAEGGPRGHTASRNTHSGRAPSLNWCGLGPSRGPFRDDTQDYVISPVLSLTSVSSKRLSHSDPVSQSGRQAGAHPILQSPFNSCQRSVTSTEVGGLYNFDTLFI